MADTNISKITLPTGTYNVKHVDAADLPITDAELDDLFDSEEA